MSRRVLGCLLVALVVASCGSTSAGSPSPAHAGTASPSPTPAPTATPTAPKPTPSPTTTPTPRTPTLAWTAKAATVLETPAKNGKVEVHLGTNFPVVVLASEPVIAAGQSYVEAVWEAPARTGRGWIAADALGSTEPKAGTIPIAGLDALDPGLYSYANGLASRIGVSVYDVTRGFRYEYNAGKGFYAASSIKVPIMMTFLWQMERKKREPSSYQMSLLTTMITHSDNDAAIQLYYAIGGPNPMKQYLAHIGVTGVAPSPGNVVFGKSPISAGGMVTLLDKLRTGSALNKAHTDLALRLMAHVISSQQVGVGDTRPPGASVWMKDGWYAFGDQFGTVMNTSGIVTAGSETYIISVYTDRDHGVSQGSTITRHVCSVVAKLLVTR